MNAVSINPTPELTFAPYNSTILRLISIRKPSTVLSLVKLCRWQNEKGSFRQRGVHLTACLPGCDM